MPHHSPTNTRRLILASLVSLMIPAIASARPGIGTLSTTIPSVFPMVTYGSIQIDPLPSTWEQARYTDHAATMHVTRALAQGRRLAHLARLAGPVTPSVQAPVAGPLAGSTSSGTADWYAIAQCESGGNWATNTGNGYWGGLQFAPSTWFGYGGGPFDGVGPFPYSASAQIAVSERVLAAQGPGAWPNCFRWG